MPLRTGRANNHIHIYRLSGRATSFDLGHNHSIRAGTTLTSIDQGHRHSLINVDDGIISRGRF